MDIGSKGLLNADLIIPQSTSLNFHVVHKDESGNVIDHSASVCKMALQRKGQTYDLSECCTPGAQNITVTIPASVSSGIKLGAYAWDMIVTTTSGDVIRLIYGNASVVDTYALDGE